MSESPGKLETLVVAVGHEELEHGRVRAELHTDGRLLVDKQYEGKSDQFELRVGSGEAEAAFRSADDLTRARSGESRGYRPVPDEARYEIEIRRPGEEPLTLTLWQNELDRDEGARKLIRSLAEQVERASDGQAIL